MKKLFLLFAWVILNSVSLFSQNFPQEIVLSSTNGDITESFQTDSGKVYIITVSGTYSMWPSYNGYGVDATYLYDVPQIEITSLRWPPQTFMGTTLYTLPYWLGTDKEIPPNDIPGLNIKFVSRKNIGFRMNGLWLENTGYNQATHSYQTKIIGDGNTIKFQILDSSYNIGQAKTLPRYEDNSGSLKIVIQEEPLLNICDLTTICKDGKIVGVKLSAALFAYNNDSSGKKYNVIKDGNEERVGVAIDGNFKCPDSIICNNSVEGGIAWCLVFDRSGSMNDPFGNSIKMTALKSSASKFLQKFKPEDEAMLITFNESVSLTQNWTKDVKVIENAINGLTPNGRTAYFDAGYMGVDNTFPHSNPNKAVILLSDGEDNESVFSESKLISHAINKNIRIFTIGVSLIGLAQESMKRIAEQTGGKYYGANDPNAMDSVFTSIKRDVETGDCCDIYFSLPDTVKNQPKPYTTNITVFTFDKVGNVIKESFPITITDSCNSKQFPDDVEDETQRIKYQEFPFDVYPNPFDKSSKINYELLSSGLVKISIYDVFGNEVKKVFNSVQDIGKYSLSLDGNNLSNGTYLVKVISNGIVLTTKKIIVLH